MLYFCRNLINLFCHNDDCLYFCAGNSAKVTLNNLFMEVLTLYFENGHQRDVAVADWYCKPAILRCLANRFGALFITSSKYGCRQFTPRWSSYYPVHNIEFVSYKQNLPWMVIEFNSFAKSGFDLCFLERLETYYESDNVKG